MDPAPAEATLQGVPFADERWTWSAATPRPAEHRGRACVAVGSTLATLDGVRLVDGAVEVELAVGPERGFHGVVWRLRDDESYESFFVRPHQVGNPDAVQYTPVFSGISAWQLYHGSGFWAPVEFPLDEWFLIRVVFSGDRAEVYVADPDEPALVIRELKRPVEPGRVGVLVGGPEIHLAGFAYEAGGVALRAPLPPAEPAPDGVVPSWWVSDAFREDDVPAADPLRSPRTWTRLPSEPSGLADLARANGIRDGRNTVLARATVHSDRPRTTRLDFGFSDRAAVYLNGTALYRGDDTYRSRDYRFLGSIGYHDSLFLPLAAGANELVFAVSESFGGWGIQARFPDPAGLSFG